MNDWTIDPKTGKSNSSEAFNAIVDVIAGLIQSEAASLINGRTRDVARLILANLAHKYHLGPMRNVESQHEDGKMENCNEGDIIVLRVKQALAGDILVLEGGVSLDFVRKETSK